MKEADLTFKSDFFLFTGMEASTRLDVNERAFERPLAFGSVRFGVRIVRTRSQVERQKRFESQPTSVVRELKSSRDVATSITILAFLETGKREKGFFFLACFPSFPLDLYFPLIVRPLIKLMILLFASFPSTLIKFVSPNVYSLVKRVCPALLMDFQLVPTTRPETITTNRKRKHNDQRRK